MEQIGNDLVNITAPPAGSPPDPLLIELGKWLGVPSINKFLTANLTEPDNWTALLLDYAGLTWDHVYDVVRQQLGAGNLAALEAVAGWFDGPDGRPLDTSRPDSIVQFLKALPDKVQALGVTFNLNIGTDIVAAAKRKIKNMLPKAVATAGAQLAAKFVPGANIVTTLVSGLRWLVANQNTLSGLFAQFTSIADDLNASLFTGTDAEQAAAERAAIARVKGKVVAGVTGAIVPLLDLAAAQLGLGSLKNQLQRAMDFVPTEVDKALKKAVSNLAAKVTGSGTAAATTPGGTSGGMFDGRLAAANEFVYRGTTTYVLWVATDKAGVKVKLAKKVGTGYEFVGEVTVQGLMGNRADAQLNALLAAARELAQKSKTPAQAANKPTPAALLALSRAVEAAEAKVVQAIQANALGALASNCFAAGTQILTRAGWRAVEDIRPGEEVLARPELDPAAAAEWKAVEERFERFGPVLHLHFPGGELIRTTREHPFWVRGEGWTPAGALRAGDRIATLSGEWVAVGEVYDTGEWEPVYNLRVADHRTYFVGDEAWGWAAWAHNTYDASIKSLSGLKVTEELAGRISLSAFDRGDIIYGIRNTGKYGAMGDRDALVSFLAYELDPANPQAYAAAALSEYLKLASIEKYRADEENIISNFHTGTKNKSVAQVSAQPSSGPIKDRTLTGWTAYLHATWSKTLNGVVRTAKGDSDARGEHYVDVRRTTRSDLHGHHIVFKEAANGGGGKAEAAEARDILLYYGINPFWDKENLVYAQVGSGHSIAQITFIRDQLKASFDAKIPKDTPNTGVIDILKEMGRRYVAGTLNAP